MLTWKSHGGSCCGISHVSGFRGEGPEALEPTLVKWSDRKRTLAEIRMMCYIPEDCPVYAAQALFQNYRNAMVSQNHGVLKGRPRETSGQRLKAYLRDIAAGRSAGTVEAVLADYRTLNDRSNQYKTWEPFLLELGFVEVHSFVNSNTSNTVHVYHFAYDKDSWF